MNLLESPLAGFVFAFSFTVIISPLLMKSIAGRIEEIAEKANIDHGCFCAGPSFSNGSYWIFMNDGVIELEKWKVRRAFLTFRLRRLIETELAIFLLKG